MSALDADPVLTGIPIHTSPWVPEDQVIRTPDGLYFHSRISARGRMRRGHGRPRNAPRRWKVKYVRYQPALDRVLEAARA